MCQRNGWPHQKPSNEDSSINYISMLCFYLVRILEVRKIVEQSRKIVNQIEGFKSSEKNALKNLKRTIEDKRRVLEENKTAKVKHIRKVETTINVSEEWMATSEFSFIFLSRILTINLNQLSYYLLPSFLCVFQL